MQNVCDCLLFYLYSIYTCKLFFFHVFIRNLGIEIFVLDDLFGDDEGDEPVAKKKTTADDGEESKTYLDENWNLSDEDKAEFKGFPGMSCL